MALRHARAAQQHAITTDALGRSILVTIAMDIGHNNQDAFPSYRTIAERVGCHYNSVSAWVKQLEDCGDLVIRKEGKRQFYNIPFIAQDEQLSQPDYDNHYDNNYHSHYDNDYDNLKEVVTSLSQQVEKLSQQVAQIVTAMTVTEDIREDIREEGKKEIYISSSGYIPPEQEPVAAMKTAIAGISKETYWPKTEQVFTDAAYELIGRDAEPDQVASFGVWWKANGWHTGKPALTNILDHWEDFKNGICLRPSKNGKAPKVCRDCGANIEGTGIGGQCFECAGVMVKR